MNFANVKEITIPEGKVKKITCNGATLWEAKGFTNLVDIATTTMGGTELYGGVGYKNGYRWSSSKKNEDASYAYARLTGWMPYVQGGLLRIKNFGLDRNKTGYTGYVAGRYLVLHKTDGTYRVSDGKWLDEDYEEISLTYTGVDYFRISGYCTHNYQGTPLIDPPIVTIDEEII